MLNKPRDGQGTGSIATLLLLSGIAGIVGAAAGAVVFGLGVYLASYSDRLMPFYQAGALAGLVPTFAYTLLSRWNRNRPDRVALRIGVAALLGTVVLWGEMSSRPLAMSLSERTVASLLWLIGSVVVLRLIGHFTKSR